MDYTYTLEKDIKAGYVRILFTESNRWPEDQSPFRGAEILLGNTFPCYAMMAYLADAERFLEQASAEEGYTEICVGRYCDNIGFCKGSWRNQVHAGISEAFLLPEDAVFVESEFKISFFPRTVLLEILRDYLRACGDCCQAHLRWLKHRKYRYTVRYDHDYGHAALKSRDRNDTALYWVTSVRDCFQRIPKVYSGGCIPDNYFAYLFRKNWVVFGRGGEEGCLSFQCLPLNVFQRIAGELDRAEAGFYSDPYEKRQKKAWKKVQLSGKMWPMP